MSPQSVIASGAVAGAVAGDLVADVAASSVIAIAVPVALPTPGKGSHRTRCWCGEGTSYTRGTRQNQDAQRPWAPDGLCSALEHKRDPQDDYQPHMLQSAVLGHLMRSLIPCHRPVAIRIATRGDYWCSHGMRLRCHTRSSSCRLRSTVYLHWRICQRPRV